MEEQRSFLEDIKTEETEASSSQKVTTIVIDLIIEFGTIVAFYLLLFKAFSMQAVEETSFLKYIAALILIFGYRLICILLSGKTIGMMISKVKYLNSNLEPLSSRERLIAVFATRTSKIKYYKEL